MKIRIIMILAFSIVVSACTEYSCPTYGSHYVYTPTKKRSFKSGGKSKPTKVRKAEQ